MKKILLISILFNVLFFVALAYLICVKTDYGERVWGYITGQITIPKRNDVNCVQSWNNCVEQLDFDFDVVFFGNSITAGNNWQEAFPDIKIINLGYIGEDVKGMVRRVPAIAAVHPQKVFVMAGINGLKKQDIEDFEFWYLTLIDSIISAVPNASIYVESILPVTKSSSYCSNEKIREANRIINKIAAQRELEYVDLYSDYADDGTMPKEWSYDGLHLKPEAYGLWEKKICPLLNK